MGNTRGLRGVGGEVLISGNVSWGRIAGDSLTGASRGLREGLRAGGGGGDGG